MRITGLSLLVFALAGVLSAADDTPIEALGRLATAISAGDIPAAVAVFDSSMKNYGSVTSAMDAMVAQNDVLCAIDIVEERGTGDSRSLDVDWYMVLTPHSGTGPVERRREKVTLGINKVKNKWKITSISSNDIISPLKVP